MTHLRFLLLILSLFLFSTVFAQNSVDIFQQADLSELSLAAEKIQLIKSVSLFGFCFVSVQLAFIFLRTKIGDVLGIYKILVLSLLSIAVTILGKILAGQNLLTAFTDAPTLAAYQVFLNQVVKQWSKIEDDKKKLRKPEDS